MRAALYHRVSTLDQNPTDLAREELRAAAARLGAEVILTAATASAAVFTPWNIT
jgi:DNA invertase Pin-like site-specific DNA recombinase